SPASAARAAPSASRISSRSRPSPAGLSTGPEGMPADLGAAILAALDGKCQIAPITDGDAGFGLDAAYRVSDAVTAARIARGEHPAGWKLGFTNRTIWDEYGVHAPIWGPIYDRTVIHAEAGAAPARLDAAAFIEPRIEPEIVFRIARPPHAGMDEAELLGCVD